ncbi:MAG TPA: hypothetical protein VMV92_37325 [Streptosporangiaceae bacterium]|nr:hypothetical protein [Streptosporangiaceae bacterium]
MASSAADRAGNRVGKGQRAIEAALAEANASEALAEATRALRSAWAHMARQRPGDAAIAAAQLAGSITATAAKLHAHKPVRPDGCPQVPGPADLLTAYREVLQAAQGGDSR